MNPHLTLRAATLALLALVSLAHAEECAKVEVQNLRPAEGLLMLAAYSDAATFRKAAITSMRVEPKTATMELQVCGLTGSSVALTVFQDLNGNGKLDSNPFGIPTEPWGSSGKSSAFSAPTWDMAHVPLDGSTIVIKLTK
jgi:uncharacterized protein (DUF2141 family)